ncbi:dihydroorotate dehydrogenase [Ceratobasidium sp. 423]|nr:dihydroorotate dehydrogenase [Ceratobasidium sp. 423]
MVVSIRGLQFSIPMLNSSCPWASNLSDLKELQYLEWVKELISGDPNSDKPIIISITFDPPGPNGNESEKSLDSLLQSIQTLRRELGDTRTNGPVRTAVEINTSCPNIPNKPPPSYEPATMQPLLEVVAKHVTNDPSLVVGLKLPPYVHSKQFTDVIDELAKHTPPDGLHPIAFLTCTNTLGSSLLFEDQVVPSGFKKPSDDFEFAVPAIYGGLAGEAIHPLSLGNVHRFSNLLKSHPDAKLQGIAVIGVGGVTSSAAASRMIRAGATLVECATLIGAKGVSAFEELSKAFQAPS